jgi:hypothetical protein
MINRDERLVATEPSTGRLAVVAGRWLGCNRLRAAVRGDEIPASIPATFSFKVREN